MGRIASFTVLALLVLQCIAEQKPFQQVFEYDGNIRVSNVAADDIAAIWSVGATVSLQYYEDHAIVKLDNVKSALVNGHIQESAEEHYKPIPTESEAILKPIIVHHEDLTNITIAYEEDDPIWSVNMKRGIVTAFMYLHNPDRGTPKEQTLYGDCNVAYDITNPKEKRFISKKTIDHTSCENSPSFDISVAQWDPTSRDYNPITYETVYTYKFNGEVDLKDIEEISTSSIMQHRSMPGVKSVQKTEQTKLFVLKSSSETFNKFDTSKITVHGNVTFDYSKGVSGDRDINNPKKTSDELIKEFNTNFEAFETYLSAIPLTNVEKGSVDTIAPMFELLNEMDVPTLEKLSKDLFSKTDNLLHQHIFLSYLPYLGSEASIKFIRSLVENQDENLNDLLAIKILSTFPVYIDDESKELVKEMEPLMHLNVSNTQVKYAGILSYASLLSDVYQNEKIDRITYQKYVNIYYQNFVDAEEYEVKMIYLLGLINMADKSFVDEIVDLCTDTNVSHHLRAIAIHGAKPTLMASGEEIFKHFWEVVKNQTEHLEIRVASLDLLLYSDISKKHFKTIVSWYHDNSDNLDEQHLANYLYTTIKALEKDVEYFHYLSEYATETFETLKPVKSDIWTTGNYRMAFSDSDANLGGSIQARFIANPKTNMINVGILSVDSFALSLNLGTYTAYIKTEGVPDFAFILSSLDRNSETPVQQLVDLIKKHGYKLKEFDGAHVEVIIFSNEKVVFGIHINKDNIDNYAENPLFVDLLKLFVSYNSLSFPLMDYTYLVSDLGTSLKISHDINQFAFYGFENFDMYFNTVDESEEIEAVEYNLKYRSIWSYSLFTEAYSPLEDTSVDTYKYVKDEKLVNIPYSFNLTDFVFKWKHTKDSFNWIQDHLLGVYIEDEDKLHQHCSECVDQVEIPLGNMSTNTKAGRTKEFDAITGVHFNVSVSERTDAQRKLDEDRYPAYLEILKNHKTNSISLPFVKPVLMAWHACLYNTFIANDLHSLSIRSEPYYEEQTETVFDLDFDSNDIKNDKDPISGEEAEFTIALTNRKSHNAEVLNYFNVTTSYKTKSEKPDGEAQPHIEHSYDIKFYYEDNKGKKMKVCLDREILYPNRRLDKFSLEPVDPAKASTKIFLGVVENVDSACPTEQYVTITELYTSTEKLKQHLESLEEHSKCKTQSKGFKYVPPTTDCLASHNVISVYDACSIFLDLTKLKDMPKEVHDLSTSEYGMKVFEYKRLNETHVSLALDSELIKKTVNHAMITDETEFQVETEDSDNEMSLSPTVVAYDDYDLQIGVSSACYITPNQIQTFYGKVLNDYNTKFGPDSVAFVECHNDTQSGLTIHRAGDNAIGFNFWSENNTIVASVHDGHAKVVYNGEPRKQTDIKDEDFKLYFLDNDVIYVTNGIVDITYTTEYISLKAPTIYNNYICGLCSGDEK